ncbi:MAG: aminopeptidase, partial [Gemmatimonadetes bacterium]|nr:aminopeptidase [Gemmatimonadota bacterium]
DAQRYSLFLDRLIDDLQAVYTDPDTDRAEKLRLREAVYAEHKVRFDADVAPTFESLRFGRFIQEPLNNAVLLGQMRYYHRLADFAAFLENHEHALAEAVAALVAGVEGVDDPFDLLPDGTDSVVPVEVQR